MLIEHAMPECLSLQLRLIEKPAGHLSGYVRFNAKRSATTLEGMTGRIAIDRNDGRCYAPDSGDDLSFYGYPCDLVLNYNTKRAPANVRLGDHYDKDLACIDVPVPLLQLSGDRKRLLSEIVELINARLPAWADNLKTYELITPPDDAPIHERWAAAGKSTWRGPEGEFTLQQSRGGTTLHRPGGFKKWPFAFSREAETLKRYCGLEYKSCRDAVYTAELPDTRMISVPMGGLPDWARRAW